MRILGNGRTLAFLAAVSSVLASCKTTIPANLTPTTAYQYQIIAVETEDGRKPAKVIWDADTPREREIGTPTPYFNVPLSAEPGIHRVRIVPPQDTEYSNSGTAPIGLIDALADAVELSEIAVLDANRVKLEMERDPNLWFVNVLPLPSKPGQTERIKQFPDLRIEDVSLYAAANPRRSKGGSDAESEIQHVTDIINNEVYLDVFVVVTAANMETKPIVLSVKESRGGGSFGENLEFTYFPYSSLPSDYMQKHKPATFGYPIYHYSQILLLIKNVNVGKAYRIALSNGATADKVSYADFHVPDSPDAIDSDNDGLPNSLEDAMARQGFKTNKYRKTVLLEVDWIKGTDPRWGYDPVSGKKTNAWGYANVDPYEIMESFFESAPVMNPDGSTGIDLIVDYGQDRNMSGRPLREGGDEIATEAPFLELSDCGILTGDYAYLCVTQNDLKEVYQPANRRPFWHYAVSGWAATDGSPAKANLFGYDIILTDTDILLGNTRASAILLVHELGHNFGLGHGGGAWNEESFTPNLPSTMSYRWQWPGPDTDCDFMGNGVMAYSSGMMAPFSESTHGEADGVCDSKPVDINRNNTKNDGPPISVNGAPVCKPSEDDYCDEDTTDTFADFNQWGAVKLQLPFSAVYCAMYPCKPWLP